VVILTSDVVDAAVLAVELLFAVDVLDIYFPNAPSILVIVTWDLRQLLFKISTNSTQHHD
jgi:hypothetical protein